MDLETFDQKAQSALETSDWRELIALYQSNDELAGEDGGFWSRLVETLGGLAESMNNPSERSKLRVACGRIHELRLGDEAAALAEYKLAWREHQEDIEPLELARWIYRRQDRHEMVLRLWELELAVATEGPGQSQVMREIGRVLLYELGQAEAALGRFELALIGEPECAETADLIAAAQLAVETGEAPDVERRDVTRPIDPPPVAPGDVDDTVIMQKLDVDGGPDDAGATSDDYQSSPHTAVTAETAALDPVELSRAEQELDLVSDEDAAGATIDTPAVQV